MNVAKDVLNILDKTHTCTYSDLWPTQPPSYYRRAPPPINLTLNFPQLQKHSNFSPPSLSQGFPVGDGRRQRQVPPRQGRPGGDTVAGRAVHAEERGQAQVMMAKKIYILRNQAELWCGSCRFFFFVQFKMKVAESLLIIYLKD